MVMFESQLDAEQVPGASAGMEHEAPSVNQDRGHARQLEGVRHPARMGTRQQRLEGVIYPRAGLCDGCPAPGARPTIHCFG